MSARALAASRKQPRPRRHNDSSWRATLFSLFFSQYFHFLSTLANVSSGSRRLAATSRMLTSTYMGRVKPLLCVCLLLYVDSGLAVSLLASPPFRESCADCLARLPFCLPTRFQQLEADKRWGQMFPPWASAQDWEGVRGGCGGGGGGCLQSNTSVYCILSDSGCGASARLGVEPRLRHERRDANQMSLPRISKHNPACLLSTFLHRSPQACTLQKVPIPKAVLILIFFLLLFSFSSV